MFQTEVEVSISMLLSRSEQLLICTDVISGPMSFVEFDNVEFATRAMQDLYGHTLGGLVKGGIRLSFSKNPLVSIVTSFRSMTMS